MASKPLAFLLLLVASAATFDDKEILDPYPKYSAFTKYLTNLKLVDVINSHQTITILVVDNTAISPISSLPTDKIKTAISAHILLNYNDPNTFDQNLNKSTLLPAIADSSKNFTELPNEQMVSEWATPVAPLNSNLINIIRARPYNLLVFQICQCSRSVQLVEAQSLMPPSSGWSACWSAGGLVCTTRYNFANPALLPI